MEIKEEIGKVIAIRKKAICSNCGTEMESRVCRQEQYECQVVGDLYIGAKDIYEYTCPNCGAKEESDRLYPNVNIVPVFDDEEEEK